MPASKANIEAFRETIRRYRMALLTGDAKSFILYGTPAHCLLCRSVPRKAGFPACGLCVLGPKFSQCSRDDARPTYLKMCNAVERFRMICPNAVVMCALAARLVYLESVAVRKGIDVGDWPKL